MATLSVFIACHNHAHLVSRAIESVFGQTRLPDQIVMVDDASSDRTGAIMAEYARKHPTLVQFVRNEKNAGLIGVVQQCLDLARCDYVTACAADDWIVPEHYARSMALLEAHPEAAILTTLGRSSDESGNDLGLEPGPVPTPIAGYLPPELCRKLIVELDSWFLGPTAIHHRERLLALGRYDHDLGSFFDNFTARMLAMRHGACFIPEPQASMRKSSATYSAGISSDPVRMKAISERAVQLMRTTYADIVPPGYPEIFERRFRFMVGSSILHWGIGGMNERFRRLTGSDWAFGIPFVLRVVALAAKVILFLAYRPGDIVSTMRQYWIGRALRKRWPTGMFTNRIA